MSPASIEKLGSYRLVNLIRSGKTCQVWEAISDRDQRRYALKVLWSEYAVQNNEEVELLKHELQIGQKLDHPRVIHIHEFGADRGNIFLVMELFAAPNLKQHILQGIEQIAPMASSCIRQASEGLAYFHQKGWVHRDIKPDNFLMNSVGDVKLIDFALAQRVRHGIAKLFRGRSKIQGTRSYMSPEQIRMQALDQRADIYSFGCMIFELLGGRPPFTGNSTNDLLMKHLNSAPPSVQTLNRNVTEQFAQLIRRAMAKRPADRPASMDDFLQEFLSVELFKVPPKPATA